MNIINNIINFLSSNKNTIISILTIIILIFVVMVCYNKWNDIFYEFGKNIYYLFH